MPRSLSKAVDQIARQSVGKDWSFYAGLLEHWQEIVGQEYSRDTTPVKMTFPFQPGQQRRSGGTLYIRLPKGLAMEFSFKSEQIKQRINSYFGYDAIAKVAIDPAYVTPPSKRQQKMLPPEQRENLAQQTQTVENTELQQALLSFGENILKTSD